MISIISDLDRHYGPWSDPRRIDLTLENQSRSIDPRLEARLEWVWQLVRPQRVRVSAYE